MVSRIRLNDSFRASTSEPNRVFLHHFPPSCFPLPYLSGLGTGLAALQPFGCPLRLPLKQQNNERWQNPEQATLTILHNPELLPVLLRLSDEADIPKRPVVHIRLASSESKHLIPPSIIGKRRPLHRNLRTCDFLSMNRCLTLLEYT